MPTGQPSDRHAESSLVEQLLARTKDPHGVVMLTRERIQETLEEAVRRGRVTRSDANELAGELVRRGRAQTEEVLADMERVLGSGQERVQNVTGGGRSRLSDGVGRLARTADRARRSVGGGAFPITDYDDLTARQVQGQLSGLTPAQLRAVLDHERRHGNRKTVLDAVTRALGD